MLLNVVPMLPCARPAALLQGLCWPGDGLLCCYGLPEDQDAQLHAMMKQGCIRVAAQLCSTGQHGSVDIGVHAHAAVRVAGSHLLVLQVVLHERLQL